MFGMTRVKVTPHMHAFVFHAKYKKPLIVSDRDGIETLYSWESLSEEEKAQIAVAILTDDDFAFEKVWGDRVPLYLLEIGYNQPE